MEMLVGIRAGTGQLPVEAWRLDVPVLLSAAAFWARTPKEPSETWRPHFLEPGIGVWELDAVLDSAGYSAMKRWKKLGRQEGICGVYPWTLQQYVELAGMNSWRWWAAPDFCCEPDVAADQEEIDRRVTTTATLLALTQMQVTCWRAAGADWLTYPVPVLQGWMPADYLRSWELTATTTATAGMGVPALVGVGSVCTRSTAGPDGVRSIVAALDRELPASTKLHLFGVKSKAMEQLKEHPRIASVDSMAWDTRAKHVAKERGVRCRMPLQREVMRAWVKKQHGRLARPQLGLFD